jgi:hypothetical protein
MELGGDTVLAAGVALLAIVSLPVLVHAATDLIRWESEPVRAVGAAAIVMGSLAMCGLVWGPLLGRTGWLVSLLALVLLKIGLGLVVVFTWRAFRPGNGAATGAMSLLLALLTASLYLDLQTVEIGTGYPVDSLGFRFGQVVTSLPFLWLGIEAALAHRATQRGESSPARDCMPGGSFGMWSMIGLVFFAQCYVALLQTIVTGPRGESAVHALRGLLYAVAAGCIYLALYAPAPTRQRVAESSLSSREQ